jgi:hypothetical protein
MFSKEKGAGTRQYEGVAGVGGNGEEGSSGSYSGNGISAGCPLVSLEQICGKGTMRICESYTRSSDQV